MVTRTKAKSALTARLRGADAALARIAPFVSRALLPAIRIPAATVATLLDVALEASARVRVADRTSRPARGASLEAGA